MQQLNFIIAVDPSACLVTHSLVPPSFYKISLNEISTTLHFTVITFPLQFNTCHYFSTAARDLSLRFRTISYIAFPSRNRTTLLHCYTLLHGATRFLRIMWQHVTLPSLHYGNSLPHSAILFLHGTVPHSSIAKLFSSLLRLYTTLLRCTLPLQYVADHHVTPPSHCMADQYITLHLLHFTTATHYLTLHLLHFTTATHYLTLQYFSFTLQLITSLVHHLT